MTVRNIANSFKNGTRSLIEGIYNINTFGWQIIS